MTGDRSHRCARATERAQLPRCDGLVAGVVTAALVLLGAASWSPVQAQQAWMPTVATAPGGTLSDDALAPPAMVDPINFPPREPGAQPLPSPLPQGAWSSIVTGALPQARGAERPAPPQGAAAPMAAPANPGPTPLRDRVVPGVVTAAAEAGVPGAEPAEESEPEAAPLKKAGPLDALPPNATAAQQYCFNTADTAADARFAWQAKKIQEMEAALELKAQQLEEKTTEYKKWLERRDDFSRKAHEKLVGFYTRMRPDAAAVQLATLDEETAAAVVTKLETKVASAIMGEMNPESAAKIATIISGAAKVPKEPVRPVDPAGEARPPGAGAEVGRPRL